MSSDKKTETLSKPEGEFGGDKLERKMLLSIARSDSNVIPKQL